MLTASPAGIAIGIALAGFGAVAAWLIVNQVKFALRADRLLTLMVAEGDPRCYPEVAVRPSGRVDPDAAATYHAECLRTVEHSPTDWRGWFLLGTASEMVRDHRGAVSALTRASQLQAREAVSAAATRSDHSVPVAVETGYADTSEQV